MLARIRVPALLCALCALALTVSVGAAEADRYDALYDPFDPGRLDAGEHRFLKAALAFEGYFDGTLAGGWDAGSDGAMAAYVADSHEDAELVWHASMLALKLRRRIAADGWKVRFLDAQGQSLLVPEATLESAGTSTHFEHFAQSDSSLRLSTARADATLTREFHNFVASQNPDGSNTRILRQPALAVTSALKPDGSVLHMRSDLVDGLWSTVVLSAGPLDTASLTAIAASITPGRGDALALPLDGELARAADLAADLLASETAFTTPDRAQLGSGTGFVVSGSGHVLTNGHVVSQCGQVAVDGIRADVVALSSVEDLALVKVDAPTSGVAAFAAKDARLNADVTVTGFPLNGLLTGLNVTRGSVSGALGIGGDDRRMQISAPIQSGNSGGPVLDASGAVVGVVVSKLNAARIADRTGEIPQNINFAIRADVARDFLKGNGLDVVEAGAASPVPPEDLAEAARRFTVLVGCL